ncbi:unnamed protein product [Arctogadus glacialis]
MAEREEEEAGSNHGAWSSVSQQHARGFSSRAVVDELVVFEAQQGRSSSHGWSKKTQDTTLGERGGGNLTRGYDAFAFPNTGTQRSGRGTLAQCANSDTSRFSVVLLAPSSESGRLGGSPCPLVRPCSCNVSGRNDQGVNLPDLSLPQLTPFHLSCLGKQSHLV